MIKSYKSSLQLNSYKLDSHTYEQKIHHLNQENQELKTVVHGLKVKEHSLIQQLTNCKLEVQTLRNKVSHFQTSPPKQEPKSCSSCSQKIAMLEREKQRANQYKEMYLNEMQNKKDLTQYYEKKLHALLRDKDALIAKYQQKIKSISLQNMPLPSKNTDSSTSLGNTLNDLPRSPQHRPIKRLLPPSPQKNTPSKLNTAPSARDKYKYELLDNLLKPCLQSLQKMNITLNQLRYIQQIERFLQLGVVPKNRYVKLFRDFPFECQNEDQIQRSFQMVVACLRAQGKQENGPNIIDVIFQRIKQLM